MNADAFRHFYEYHFAQNRKVWDAYITSLAPERFTEDVTYSHGSVRDQLVHLMNVDDAWFGQLRGADFPESLADDVVDRGVIRAHWDKVEQRMRDYLATVRDEMLLSKPFPEGEDKDLVLWQVLLHVGNHGTDHRAQILRLLSDLGVKTEYQDYVFYAYEHPVR